ncbi:L-2,4-diaminobutyric acid acetyltransferase [Streptomyces avermitilis]|uniref:L-2,4-diaminobutyric acid acetyltransferase n=2 Tax=Streptomyces avermitilis TaxID=33903 RepID=ECTA_STRAW|nr:MULTISPECIES: diaminobutyrate acetyltransferase [Streptomyces]Q829L3.1 RecName: Full=L-2,4-diaminobutyric acid acetyltransferase; Short=DABA acetyltransferase [Streptomyces avermitilis MA-4680 = NBRC 14893]KUN54084.1 L-2,4-diaminobutyric acid acetyltransferase [Streptomyces avermitilis]MYT01946.1 L-2,4-diaminobutyric acid acetyltransferase [Streptomyces sp. SID5469]OOV11526.1 L-2,4-diaminobutyric acid acetyltransferase [Streptomyces avermitilis]BAC74109.1 L-2,4-diaminobutyrate acetyltransfe
MTAAHADLQAEFLEMPEGLRIDRPDVADGSALWRIAKDSKTLDLNSSYSYLLWCRDFAGTTAVARAADGTPVGFITAYVRPERPHTLLVWQVAVDAAYRGRGLAARMLDGLTARVTDEYGVTGIETTISPGNTASERLFTSYAQRHGADLEREVLFEAGLFPDAPHDPEVLYRIGPLSH